MLTKAEGEFGKMPIAALDDPRVRKDLLDWREKIARASGQREAEQLAIRNIRNADVVGRNHLRGVSYHADRSEII